MSKQPNPKIIIRTPNWLGDLVISTGFINAVLEKFPESIVDLIVTSGFENLPLRHRGEVIIFNRKFQSISDFGKKLRRKNYEIFFVLPPSFSSAWMSYISKTPKRIGYFGLFRSFLLTNAKKYDPQPRKNHILKEYLNLLDSDISIEKYPPYLRISTTWANNQLNSYQYKLPKSFFVFSPGATYGPAKQWPAYYFRELALKMVNFFEIPILILGTEKEIITGDEISNGIELVTNLCGKTTLTEMLAILSKAKLLVGNDSGSMHLMSAMQLPQIAIFGSTSPIWTSPINPNSKVVTKNLSCSPCFARKCRYDHYKCLQEIKPDEVLENVQNILSLKE